MAPQPPHGVAQVQRPVKSCQQCRARKVKCDRKVSGCTPCSRLEMACSYVHGADTNLMDVPAQQLTQAGTKRRRILRACRKCHEQRTKCTGGIPCEKCESLGITCVERLSRRYPSRAAHSSEDVVGNPVDVVMSPGVGSVSVGSSAPSEQPLLTPLEGAQPTIPQVLTEASKNDFNAENRHLIRQYLDAYFARLDPFTCMFLHKATFINIWQNGRLDRTLLQIVAAFGAKLLDPGSTVPDVWAKEVQRTVLRRFNDMSMTQLRTIVALLHYSLYYGEFDTTWMLLGLGARIALSKRLNFEIPCDDIIAQEGSRRLMWSIFLLDKAIGGGMEDMSVVPADRMHIRLPGNERCFAFGISPKTHFLKRRQQEEPGDMGILAYLVRLGDIRGRVLSYTKAVIRSGVDPSQSEANLRNLVEELRFLKDKLPPELVLSPQNLLLRSHTPQLTGYLLLHTFWYQCHCDLYRFTISGIRGSVMPAVLAVTPRHYVEWSQRECLNAAMSQLTFWSDLYHVDAPKPMDHSTFGVCAYECLKIIISLAHLLPSTGDFSLSQLSVKMLEVHDMLSRARHAFPMIERCMPDIERVISKASGGSSFDSSEGSRESISSPGNIKSKHSFIPLIQDDRSDYSGARFARTEHANLSVSSPPAGNASADAGTGGTPSGTIPIGQFLDPSLATAMPPPRSLSFDISGGDLQSVHSISPLPIGFDQEMNYLFDPFDIQYNSYYGDEKNQISQYANS